MRRHARQPNVFTLASWVSLAHEQGVQREANVERICFIDLLDVFAGQLERKSGDVAVKVRDLAVSNN